MNDLSKILRAASFAANRHSGQRRKGASGEPYINHPLEVANMLVNVGRIEDPDVIAAALLHDTVEDTSVTAEEIEQEFGRVVADYVREVTDDKSLPKAERKRLQIEHAPHLSTGAKQIKLADKISNIRDITTSPPEGWDLQRRRDYVEWGVNVVNGLRGVNPALDARFDNLVESSKDALDRARA